jgi:H+/Cl- antiporter ClcA
MALNKNNNPVLWVSQKLSLHLDKHRIHLSRPDALIQLTFLGLLTGILAGGVIVLFRILVEENQAVLLPGNSENYEALSIEARFLFPVIGSLIIAVVFHFFSKGIHVLGVARVIERMAFHQGYLTLRGFLLQFFGAAVAIISGHSVGREGPNVFLGAASGSLLGQFLTLPNNSIRTLVGCGTAAGIAASFDTPLAGVIFSLEVVMMEYTLAAFLPITIAAGSATMVSIFVFGNEPAFVVPHIQQGALTQLPLVILLGLLAGTLSAFFIHLLQSVAHHSRTLGFTTKIMLSGVIVGLIASMMPAVMGIGYDTVSQMLAGEIALNILLLLLLLKLLATVASIGLGIPGGSIGPVLFLGACLGGSFGLIVRLIFPELQADAGFYSLLGMGAVMGASLQAPLAALTAMMELTHSPQIIMPGMIAIVIANLTASEVFRKKSLFLSVLEASEVNVYTNPITQTLRRIGVASVMNKAVIQVAASIELERVESLFKDNPKWLLIEDKNHQHSQSNTQLMPAIELVKYLESSKQESVEEESIKKELDLLEIPAKRMDIASIHLQATLEEALNKLDKHNIDALYVERMSAPGIMRLYGVITRAQIESAYQLK